MVSEMSVLAANAEALTMCRKSVFRPPSAAAGKGTKPIVYSVIRCYSSAELKLAGEQTLSMYSSPAILPIRRCAKWYRVMVKSCA